MLSNEVYAVYAGVFAGHTRRSLLRAIGGKIMQIVVLRSPKALRGLLKLLFKIKDT